MATTATPTGPGADTAIDPDIAAVRAAGRRIRRWTRRTPVLRAAGLSSLTGADVHLKLESLQHAGAFKVRGARNALLSLSRAARATGVITVSTGNHGRAVATVAGELGIPCVVCLSTKVPRARVEAIRSLGAEVVVEGASHDEAADVAARLSAAGGLTLVHPFDDPAVIAGQGTIGIELLAQVPQLDAVLVPMSGGGLIAGIAIALKAANPRIEVIGVSSAACPAMLRSVEAGRPLEVQELPSIADNLGGGIGPGNRYTLRLVSALVDRHVVVDDAAMARAMAHLYDEARLVAEASGAAATAGLLAMGQALAGRRVAAIVSGGNIEPDRWAKLIAGGPHA